MHRLTLLITLLLCGCTTVGKDVTANQKAVPSGRGIVVFSTSADDISFAFPTKMILVEGESLKKYDKFVIFIDSKTTPSFSEQNTHVRSLTLKPGRYYLVPLPGNPAMRVVKTPVYTSSVNAGEIEYVGNVLLKTGSLLLSPNARDRDVRYFLERNPSLQGIDVKTRTMTVDRYISPDGDVRFDIKGIIWEAPE